MRTNQDAASISSLGMLKGTYKARTKNYKYLKSTVCNRGLQINTFFRAGETNRVMRPFGRISSIRRQQQTCN